MNEGLFLLDQFPIKLRPPWRTTKKAPCQPSSVANRSVAKMGRSGLSLWATVGMISCSQDANSCLYLATDVLTLQKRGIKCEMLFLKNRLFPISMD